MKRTLVKVLRAGVIAGAVAGSIGAYGADVDQFVAQKGSIYTQTDAGTPTPLSTTPYLFRAITEGDINSIIDVTVRTPIGADLVLQLDDAGSRLQVEVPMPSLATLNTIAPIGTYTFAFDTENDSVTAVQMTLDGTAFPTAVPTIANFAAAQTIDPDTDFNLAFNAFGNGSGTERWELEILEDGFAILTDAGMGSSVTIPQGALFSDSTYEVRLRFVREVDRDTTSYPGAIGAIELFNETRFTVSTGTGGGGGDDTTPPTLFFSNPPTGATDVIANTPITFVFSEPMAQTQSIEWSANLNTANFNYTWLEDGTVLIATYLGGLPANATITWKLNPTDGAATNFRDLAGNVLPVNQSQGSFSTAAGGGDPNDPCNPTGDDGRGGGSIFKALNYVQVGNTVPVLDPEMPATASAFVRAGTNQAISAVSLTTPVGTENLTSLFGNFFLSEEFTNAASLEAAFPAGNYTVTLTGTGGGSATIAVGSTAQIPIPQIGNLTALSTMNVSNDFTLNFSAFTGAGQSDGIFIEISGDEGQGEFMAPDPCVPRELPNTATSVVIPARTFKSGQAYRGSITFSRAGQDSSSIPNTTVVAGTSIRTTFEFTIGGVVTPRQPMWADVVRNANGTLTYTIQGDTGLTVSIEGSDSANTGWGEVASGILTAGSFQFTIDPKLAPKRFLRARVL